MAYKRSTLLFWIIATTLIFWTYTSYRLTLITNYNSNVLQKLRGVTIENIILTRGAYIDFLINGQVIGLGRVESTNYNSLWWRKD